jgi:hypothetical protein
MVPFAEQELERIGAIDAASWEQQHDAWCLIDPGGDAQLELLAMHDPVGGSR